MNGFLSQWDFHRVQEHPKRSSNERVMTFQSWRSYIVTLIVSIQIFIVPYKNTRLPYTHSFHTGVRKSILFHTELNKFHTFLYKIIVPYKTILKFHTYDLLFPFLLSSFLFSSSSSSSFLFSSLLYVFALSFSKTKMRYLFWSYPYLILSPFYFTFYIF